jgi:hypothetical protein
VNPPFGSDQPLPDGLRDAWGEQQLTSVWLRPADWFHPAVDGLAEAVLAGGDPTEAARELGRSRAVDGIGVGEALDDLTSLYRSTGASAPPHAAIRALCEGWTDAQVLPLLTGSALDAETGLPTRGYLEVRLAEAYACTEPDELHLTIVDVAAGAVSGFLRIARSAAAGAALTSAFGPGRPMASLGGGLFAILVRHDDDLAEPLAVLHDELHRRCSDVEVRVTTRQPVRIWTHPLPATHDEAVALLHSLARSEL